MNDEQPGPRQHTPRLGPCQRGRALINPDLPGWTTPCPREGETILVIRPDEPQAAPEEHLHLALCQQDMDVLEPITQSE